MSGILTLIDELVGAVSESDLEQAIDLGEEIDERYEERETEQRKQIRKASVARRDVDLTEEELETLETLIQSAGDISMTRAAFSLKLATVISQLDEGESPDEEFGNTAAKLKQNEEELDQKVQDTEPIVDKATIGPSVEILSADAASPVTVGDTGDVELVIINVGDDSAESVTLEVDSTEGLSVSTTTHDFGTINPEEEVTESYTFDATATGDERLLFSLSSDNAGSDGKDVNVKVEEDVEDPALENYADSDGIIRLTGLRDAIADWRDGVVTEELLGDIVDAWRIGRGVD